MTRRGTAAPARSARWCSGWRWCSTSCSGEGAMSFDLRLPIGLMFSVFGVLLTVFGLVSDRAIYQRSLGINVNLWWGLVLVVFGVVMLGLAMRGRRVGPPREGVRLERACPPARTKVQWPHLDGLAIMGWPVQGGLAC